jgi:hypothetical protein
METQEIKAARHLPMMFGQWGGRAGFGKFDSGSRRTDGVAAAFGVSFVTMLSGKPTIIFESSLSAIRRGICANSTAFSQGSTSSLANNEPTLR